MLKTRYLQHLNSTFNKLLLPNTPEIRSKDQNFLISVLTIVGYKYEKCYLYTQKWGVNLTPTHIQQFWVFNIQKKRIDKTSVGMALGQVG